MTSVPAQKFWVLIKSMPHVPEGDVVVAIDNGVELACCVGRDAGARRC
jgi:hypothetical protein